MTTPIKDTVSLQPTEEEKLAYKRRLFETADRSYVNDRLQVPDLPPDLHGEWIGVDDFSQFHAQQKGYIDGSQYLGKFNRIHDGPTGPVIGDVKFMVIPKWKYEAQIEIERLSASRRSGIESDAARKEYEAYARQLGLGIEPDQSFGRVLSGTELSAHIKR